MTLVGQGRALTPTDYKTLEGQRIQALMAAVAALPGAALVASGPEGAPFFAAALVAISASFMFWILTDAIYHFSTVQPREPAEWNRILRAGHRYQWACTGYGGLSVLLSMIGFAGVHSGISGPWSVATGFLVALGFFAGVMAHVVWASHERNQIAAQTRAASAANRT
jgi:4-hydroxybenzoate polyprenyltransferase